ncbi:MAG: hypothetical protein ACRDWI_04720, partial [Jiangellaceae bacterium]
PLPRLHRAALGAAAVRSAAQAVTAPSAASRAAAATARARQVVNAEWSVAVRRVEALWQRYPVSRFGLSGLVMLVLVVVAVIAGTSDAAGAPAADTSGAGTGTVRVDDVPGKGSR